MADIVSPAVRSRMMSGIRSKDTRHEVKIRKALHAAGFRYRLHRRDLPGTPDITLPRYRAVIFVHGCFWHGHDCHLFKWPATNSDKWGEKIRKNQSRDVDALQRLLTSGWRVCAIWECALRGRQKRPLSQIIDDLSDWILGSESSSELRGIEKCTNHKSLTG